MTIELNNKETQTLGRLRTALNSGMIPLDDLKSFLSGLQRKVPTPTADPGRKKTKGVKQGRKDRYRIKMRIAS